MDTATRVTSTILVVTILVISRCSFSAFAGNFNQDVDLTWGGDHAEIQDGGNSLQLLMNMEHGGAGFQSKNDFLFGRFDVQMKLVPGESGGTIAAFYISSEGLRHDEVDMEFVGNTSGQPYTLHTNVFVDGLGGREQKFRLWFDPTQDFHTYSIVWNPTGFILLVDETPVRLYKNLERVGLPYANKQRMRVYGSIWSNTEGWATNEGKVHLDWSKGPFVVHYRNYNANPDWTSQIQDLDRNGRRIIRQVQYHNMFYDYCTDTTRYVIPPIECSYNKPRHVRQKKH